MPRQGIDYALELAYHDAPNPRAGNQRNFVDAAYATWWIERGAVDLEAAGRRQRATRGTWVFCDPFLMRSQRFSSDAVLLSVRFRMTWNGACHFPQICPPRIVPADDPEFLAAARSVVEAFSSNRSDRSFSGDCRLRSCFYGWLALWHERRERWAPIPQPDLDDPIVNRVISLLSRDPGIGVIDYARLTAEVQRSRSQIDRLFRHRLGLTPRQWCERRRLATAEDWLGRGEMPIKAIAYRLGFVDASHFARWFRRQTGRAPTAFRAAPPHA